MNNLNKETLHNRITKLEKKLTWSRGLYGIAILILTLYCAALTELINSMVEINTIMFIANDNKITHISECSSSDDVKNSLKSHDDWLYRRMNNEQDRLRNSYTWIIINWLDISWLNMNTWGSLKVNTIDTAEEGL